MARNKNVEAIRGIAMISMLLYHYMLSISGFKTSNPYAPFLIESLGQFALISFFILSGFGTYLYFSRQDADGNNVSAVDWFKRRLKSIVPQYYVCLLFILMFTPAVNHLSTNNIKLVMESLLFVHNFNPHNVINGVTWTLAVLLQLSLFAKPLFKLIKKFGFVVYPCSVIFCVLLKVILALYIEHNELNAIWYVVETIRIPFTTIDLFAAGMCSAFLYEKALNKDIQLSKTVSWLSVAAMLVIYPFCFLRFVLYLNNNIWGSRIIQCSWQSAIGFWIAAILFIAAIGKPLACKGIQFIAQNEYGIYLWHMVLLGNLRNSSIDWYVYLQDNCPVVLLIVMIFLAVGVGTVSNHLRLSSMKRA